MDSFFQSVITKLKAEEKAFMSAIDADFKKLHADMYECSSKCFSNPGSLSDSRSCASNCTSKGFQFRSEINDEVQKSKKEYASCVQQCKESYPDMKSGMKSCVYDCIEDGVEVIKKMTVRVQDMFKYYK
ncbi:unnamed protein product [Blepharisma stoltei]|uniref:Uncharacterized protein n=1 Tax=Blepharisma stoltei TaxID=1481888 RepID=A0AAU9JCJ8_9CILI|nr:unnamed protein product [Blepharisma stoltei]